MKINLKNSKDYNRAIQLLEVANVKLGSNFEMNDKVTVKLTHIYDYECPHCGEEYTELGEELSQHFDQETELIQCKCGKQLKPLIQNGETVAPIVQKSTDEEVIVQRIAYCNEADYSKIVELLHLAGIETCDLGEIEQVIVYITHAYEFECPACGSLHQYPAYDDFHYFYEADSQRVFCDYCDEKFKVQFKHSSDSVFEQ